MSENVLSLLHEGEQPLELQPARSFDHEAELTEDVESNPTGLAATLREALESPTVQLLITDQRILAVDVTALDDPEIEWQLDRDSITNVHRRARSGVIDITFVDGSAVAVHVGMLGGKGAAKCVRALEEHGTVH